MGLWSSYAEHVVTLELWTNWRSLESWDDIKKESENSPHTPTLLKACSERENTPAQLHVPSDLHAGI